MITSSNLPFQMYGLPETTYSIFFPLQQPEKKMGLRVVIPIVVYHGRQTWKKRTFTSHFPGLDDTLRPYIPHFEYLLTDLRDWSDEALMTLRAGLVRNVMLMLKHYRDEVYTQRHIERLFIDVDQYLEDPDQKLHIDKLWVYLLDTNELKKIDFRKLFNRLSSSLKNVAMPTYQQIKQEGNKEKENLFITNLLNEGFDIPTIARLTSLAESK